MCYLQGDSGDEKEVLASEKPERKRVGCPGKIRPLKFEGGNDF